MKFVYNTNGTCSVQITIDYHDDIIDNVTFLGGCNGNSKGINELVKGMHFDDVIKKLKGVTCGFKPTSCPDQLARALEKLKESKGE